MLLGVFLNVGLNSGRGILLHNLPYAQTGRLRLTWGDLYCRSLNDHQYDCPMFMIFQHGSFQNHGGPNKDPKKQGSSSRIIGHPQVELPMYGNSHIPQMYTSKWCWEL